MLGSLALDFKYISDDDFLVQFSFACHFSYFWLTDDIRLTLFGSSVNGFRFKKSDLDICLRFGTDEPPTELDYSKEVVDISRCLSKHKEIKKVKPIKTAKVPIVKFYLPTWDLDGDISFYNTLALHNSVMLASYARIDERVRIMGYCIKVFAKVSVAKKCPYLQFSWFVFPRI